MRLSRFIGVMIVPAAMALSACADSRPAIMSDAERKQIADSIETLVRKTYDLSAPDPVRRLMSLYPDSGPVYSTSSGHVSTTRRELEEQIGTFWQYVGSNMKDPEWEWTSMHVDVTGPDAAVVTAAYRIPHMTPRNTPHVIAGAWTAAFVRRSGRWVVIQEHLSDVPQQAQAGDTMDHTGH